MNKTDLVIGLTELRNMVDDAKINPIEAHVRADQLLLDYVGDTLVEEIFNEIENWYA